jgi:selT/selW/selH-like putative selenoprotein
VDATLVRGGGGEFEVMVDGKLVFSKKQLGRFPDHDEVLGLLPDQAPPENAR